MQSQKKYTNQTFTKRVDHEAGRHHTLRSAAEPTVCEMCGAIYADKRWTLKGKTQESDKHEEWRPANQTICPACKQIEEGVFGGYLNLSGAFFVKHRDEIIRLLENEAAEAAEDNPLSRIMKLEDEKDGKLNVMTTTEHLAQRLGHALHKAYRGKVEYDFSHENKLARVIWHRD